MMKRLLALFLVLILPVCSVSAAEMDIAAVDRNFLSGYMPVEDIADLKITAEQLEELKTVIFSAAKAYESECDITRFEIPYTENSLAALSSLIGKEDPEAFHIDLTQVTFSVGSFDGERYFTKVKFKGYGMPQEEYEAKIAECEQAAAFLMRGIGDELTDVEKLLVLHDRLAVHCQYDYDNLLDNTVPEDSFTIYGALVHGVAVCEGYAKSYSYMLDKLGIENYICVSIQLNHMWNIVQVGGEYYHVDVTYDDPVYDILGRVNHTYFLRSTKGMRENQHNTTDYNDTPDDETYDAYFWQNSESAFELLGDTLYYIDHENDTLNSWKDGEMTELRKLQAGWPAGNATWGNNARLSSDGVYLYYSQSHKVMRYFPRTDKATEFYTPTWDSYSDCAIFGFTVQDNQLLCDIYSNPNNSKADQRLSFSVAVPEPISVTLKQPPYEKEYYVGEELNTTGLVLCVEYEHASPEEVSDGYTVSGFDNTVVGEQVITVTYRGFTVEYTVQVRERETSLVYGEVNGDGKVDSTDARLVLQYFVGTILDDDLDVAASDVNGDGKVDSTDARLILQFFVGSIPQFPRAA